MDFLVMEIDHIHFYVDDIATRRNWFIQNMGCETISATANHHTATEVLKNGAIYFVISSALNPNSPVTHYLKKHPPGVADIAIKVHSIETQLAKADQVQVSLQTIPFWGEQLKWAKISGWGSLSHTLIENTSPLDFCQAFFGSGAQAESSPRAIANTSADFTQIDHVVLNVAAGALSQVVEWYRNLFDFQVQQTFQIQTETSGLNSQVLMSQNGQVYFNINEPSSSKSQIQEFLDENRGPGIQHIALKTPNILQAVRQMRQRSMKFLSVPATYYSQLSHRLHQGKPSQFLHAEIQDIIAQNILVDWQKNKPDSILLQIFSHPIFEQRTFFLS
jgi:4-hydroxyphenylpyruvate dioxygenase